MPTPSSPAVSDETTTQRLSKIMRDQKVLLNFWEMIRERPMTKTSDDIEIIYLSFATTAPDNEREDWRVFYHLQHKYHAFRRENYGKIYFNDCPKLPDDVVSYLVTCAVGRGCDVDDIVRRFGEKQDGLEEMMRAEKEKQEEEEADEKAWLEEEEANEKAQLEEGKNVQKDRKASGET